MIPIGTTEAFLADLKRIEDVEAEASRQISSGRRVERPSDSPGDVTELIALRAELDRTAQITSNLERVSAEVNAADVALDDAVRTLDAARALALQAAGSLRTAEERAILAEQARVLQEHLVALSCTKFEGRYVFGGDADQSPPYELDTASPAGVVQLTDGSATCTAQDAAGMQIAYRRSAQSIFDDPAASAFAAIQSLCTALETDSDAGIDAALDALRSVSEHLNAELGFYGAVQGRVKASIDICRKFGIQTTTELSTIADADIPAAITRLEQVRVQKEALLTMQARKPQTLFELLR